MSEQKMNTEYKSDLNIIETNLTPSKEMEKNIAICTIIVDSTNTDSASIYELNDEAKNKGLAMFTHHYYITKDGKIFRGRQESYKPDIDTKFNLNCIGILLEGNFNKDNVNILQFNNLMALIYDICARNPYIESSIFTHSELNPEEFSYTPGRLFPFVDFRNRLYRNFLNMTETATDINGDLYYIYGSRALEYQIPNMVGSDIYQLKVFLIRLGYRIEPLDGIYDTNLKEIVIRYCKDFNIKRETYYNGILVDKDLLELRDRVINSIYNRDDNYRRYLKLKDPIMFGYDIKILKEKLWTLGLYEGDLNNLFDEDMKTAVKNFERKYGILEDGEVGSLLFSEIMKCIDYTFKRVLELAEPLMEGADVEIIQKALFRKGYNVDINGFYDMKTYTAVCNYQLDNNLVVDGRIDQYLFEEILKDYDL